MIELYGKTGWAKRIIAEHGTTWQIITTSESGISMKVQSALDGYNMVILVANDPSFGIEYKDGK